MLRFLEVVFFVTMSSLGIVERAEIYFLVSSRFIRVLTTRTLATCCSVNTVIIYLMNLILVSRCVLYLSCINHDLCFYSVVMILSSPCFIDDMVLIETMTWRTKKTGKAGFTIIDDGEFCCIVGSHGELFGAMDDGVVIGGDFRRRIKEFDGGKDLTVF